MSIFKTIARHLCGAGLGLLLAGQVGQAMAACTQADAVGSWQVYSISAENGFSSVWTRCTLEIKPNGTFDNVTSACTRSNGRTSRVFGLLQLIGTQGCIFNGYIYLDGFKNQVTRATMNRSKDHVDGVGTFPNGIFFFSMTKP